MYTRGQGSPLAQSFIGYMSNGDISHLFSSFGLRYLTDIPLDIRNKHVLEAVVLQKIWEGCYGREGSPSCSA
jgi:hypothetical protein